MRRDALRGSGGDGGMVSATSTESAPARRLSWSATSARTLEALGLGVACVLRRRPWSGSDEVELGARDAAPRAHGVDEPSVHARVERVT